MKQVRELIGNSVWDSVRDSVWNLTGSSVQSSVLWHSVGSSVKGSVMNTVKILIYEKQ